MDKIDKQIVNQIQKFHLYLHSEKSDTAKLALEQALMLKVEKIVRSLKDKPLNLNK